jgi:glyoxylase-like metal-dependent hydrolase (beta-lactamase superfamily II)/rhodanese-related sulfurtransferase
LKEAKPMLFRQYELGCLSLYSYMVGDTTTGRAVVIDPQRDITGYSDDAAANALRIERVIETHFHADFASGHLELARATGAVVSFGEGAAADFPIDALSDGQRLNLGEVMLEVRATPGHTPESISVVLWESRADPAPWGVLTGDTLFIGDVGRPDLLSSAGLSADDLARRLYRSVHDKLLSLPDATRVFPAHGAGSACGRAMSSAPSSTIGEQRRTNYALAAMTEEAFVSAVTADQPLAPPYFTFAAAANRLLHPLFDDQSPPAPLRLEDVLERRGGDGVLLDTRSPQEFASGHLRGSINVSLEGRFAEYAGDVVAPGRPIVVIADAGRETEAKTRLARIGFDTVDGYLPDIERVLADNPQLAEQAARLTATDLAEWADQDTELRLVDVRNPSEQQAGTIPGSLLAPLRRLVEVADKLEPTRPTVVFCASGIRSSIGASVLRTHGFKQVSDLLGGFDAWAATGLPVARPAI